VPRPNQDPCEQVFRSTTLVRRDHVAIAVDLAADHHRQRSLTGEQDLHQTKREVNELMRETLRNRRDGEPIAFFCECSDESC
jgi:hypothetical protein